MRIADVTPQPASNLLALRCPEADCGKLLVRIRAMEATVETWCRHCGTKGEWSLRPASRPMYRVVGKRV